MLVKIFVCVLCAAALAGAQDQTKPKPNPRPKTVCPGDCTNGREKVKDVLFDSDGGFTGRRLYARQDCLRVSLRGPNPNKECRVQVNETVVSEGALGTVSSLTGISIPSSQSAATPDDSTINSQFQQAAVRSAMPLVSTAESNSQSLSNLTTELSRNFKNLRDAFATLKSATNSATAKGAATTVLQELDNVSRLHADATGALTFNAAPNAADAATSLRLADKSLQSQRLSTAVNQTAIQADKRDLFDFASAHAADHDARVAADSTSVERYAAFLDSISSLKAKVQAIQSAAESIVMATIFGDWHEARTITLQLQCRTDPSADFENVGAAITLTMGQPVFAMAGGFAISPLAKITYQTLGATSNTSNAPTGSNSSNNSNGTIGYQEHSSTRVQPMAFIGASLWDGTTSWLHGSLHMMAGFTVANNQISTNPEFLFGPALSFLREQLFFTAGAYAGFQQVLQGGYTVGGAAPSGSIPTLNQLHWRPGFAISWRILSASKSKGTNPAPSSPAPSSPKKGSGGNGGQTGGQ